MNELNLLLAQNPNFKIVEVKFNENSKNYAYKTFEDFEVGDTAIVDSPYNGLVTVEIVKVHTFSEYGQDFKLKWIIQKVCTENYERIITMENKLSEKLSELKAARLAREFKETLALMVGDDSAQELIELTKSIKGE